MARSEDDYAATLAAEQARIGDRNRRLLTQEKRLDATALRPLFDELAAVARQDGSGGTLDLRSLVTAAISYADGDTSGAQRLDQSSVQALKDWLQRHPA